MKTANAARLSPVVEQDGGRVRQWMLNNGAGLDIHRLPAARVRELAAANDVPITDLREKPFSAWCATRNYDKLT